MINLHLAGGLNRCTAFDKKLDLARVRRLRADWIAKIYLRENLEACKRKTRDEALRESLRDALDGAYHKGVRYWPRRGMRYLKRGYKRLREVK